MTLEHLLIVAMLFAEVPMLAILIFIVMDVWKQR